MGLGTAYRAAVAMRRVADSSGDAGARALSGTVAPRERRVALAGGFRLHARRWRIPVPNGADDRDTPNLFADLPGVDGRSRKRIRAACARRVCRSACDTVMAGACDRRRGGDGLRVSPARSWG